MLIDSTVVKFARFASIQRRKQDSCTTKTAVVDVEKICPELKVQHGPFRGMRYPGYASAGSALIPKLIGSYEKELHEVVEELCSISFTEVVDVGCAEGYYAIGFALRIRSARVLAYDTDVEALKLCRNMAELNGVSDRVQTAGFCDDLLLSEIAGKAVNALIICDCEGFERDLFSDLCVSALASHTVLIEVHDFVDPEISGFLRKQFRSTHDLSVISSIDDIHKAQSYVFPELEKLTVGQRWVCLAEHRPHIMQWFLLRPRAV